MENNQKTTFLVVGTALICILGLIVMSPAVTKKIMPAPMVASPSSSPSPSPSAGISLRYFNAKYPYIFDYTSDLDAVECSPEEVFVVPDKRNFDPCGEYKPENSFSVSTKPEYSTYQKNLPESYSSDYTITRSDTVVDGEKAVKYVGVRKNNIPRAEKISLIVVTHKNKTYVLSNVNNSPEASTFRFYDSKDISINASTKKFISHDGSATFEYPSSLYSEADVFSIGTGQEVYFFFKNGTKANPSESDSKGNEVFLVFVSKGPLNGEPVAEFEKNGIKFNTDLYDTTAYGENARVTFRITPENKTYQNQLFSTLKFQ